MNGKMICTARETAGLTQKELAKKSGIALSSLRRYEADLRQPTIRILEKIAKALNITLAMLLGIEKSTCLTKTAHCYLCQNCGEVMGQEYPYCPYCGAKVEGID